MLSTSSWLWLWCFYTESDNKFTTYTLNSGSTQRLDFLKLLTNVKFEFQKKEKKVNSKQNWNNWFNVSLKHLRVNKAVFVSWDTRVVLKSVCGSIDGKGENICPMTVMDENNSQQFSVISSWSLHFYISNPLQVHHPRIYSHVWWSFYKCWRWRWVMRYSISSVQ